MMPKNRPLRLVYALVVAITLIFIGRNLYQRHLNNALVAAVNATDVPAVRSLLHRGADPNCTGVAATPEHSLKPPEPAMDVAFDMLCFRPSTDAATVMCLLIRAGANVRPSRGRPYLEWVCGTEYISVARCLLESGADLNTLDPNGWAIDAAFNHSNLNPPRESDMAATTLQKSAMARAKAASKQMVQLLREHGAHLTLGQAYDRGDRAAVEEILRETTPISEQDGARLLVAASGKGDLYLIQHLLARAINPNVPDRGQRLPLTEAVDSGNVDVIRLLLAHGADVNAHVEGGHTALVLALKKNQADIVTLLRQAGAKE